MMRAFLALSLAFAAAACGMGRAGPAAEAPSSAAGVSESGGISDVIFVVPADGVPVQTALVLADAIAAEIRDRNHPAILAYEPNQSGASVVGQVISADPHDNVMWLALEWSVRAPYGTHVATYRQQVVIDRAMWEQAAPEAVNLLISDAAPKIVDMVADHVGPPMLAAMREYRSKAEPEAAPGAVTAKTTMELRQAESGPTEPLAAISEATNGHVVRPEGSPLPPPVTTDAATAPATTGAPAPATATPPAPVTEPVTVAERPSLSGEVAEPGPSSGPPVALEPGAQVVGPPPGGVVAQESTDEEEGFLDRLTANLGSDERRPGDARPAEPGGFSKVRWGRPAFLIRPVIGAPGNGNQALTAALKTALRDRDLTISEDPRQAGFVIDGKVKLGDPVNGRQYVKITWAVNTVTGAEVGKAVQENTIVAGSLDGEWGQVAEVVSSAAVRGIQDLFGEADDRLQDREKLPEFPDVDLPSVPGRAPPPPSSY